MIAFFSIYFFYHHSPSQSNDQANPQGFAMQKDRKDQLSPQDGNKPIKKTSSQADRKVANTQDQDPDNNSEDEEVYNEYEERIEYRRMSGGDLLIKEQIKKYFIEDRVLSYQNLNYYPSSKYVTVPDSEFDPSLGKKIESLYGHTIFEPKNSQTKSTYPKLMIDANTSHPVIVTGVMVVKPQSQSVTSSGAQKISLEYNLEFRELNQLAGLYFFKAKDIDHIFTVAEQLNEQDMIDFAEIDIVSGRNEVI